MPEREGTFYPVWPVIDGKNLNMQWGEIRSNTAETKAIVRNSVQDLETGVDELNALRALLGQEYGDLDFRNKFRFFYNKTTFELCCQKNDGTVDVPVWIDAWCVRFTDGQFQAVGTGGIQSDAGFYGPGLSSIGQVGETGSLADNSIDNPTKLFFNTDDGLNVVTIPSGGNAGAPEIRFTQPFGRAETFDQLGREWIVQHNFDASPVMVQVYDEHDKIIFPDKADVSDPNIAYFYFHAATTGKVTIATGGTGAASLVPKDPFYLVVRTDGQAADSHTLDPNADLIFDANFFYVNVDLDTDTGGSHKKAFVSLTGGGGVSAHGSLTGLTADDHAQYVLTDGTREITSNQKVRGDVEAAGFYLSSGVNGIASDLGSSWMSFDIPGAAVDNYFIDTAGEAYLVDEVNIVTSTGSATVAFYIHQDGERFPGVSITGLDPIAASSTRTTATATGSNIVADGDEVVLSVPANSFATHLRGSMKIRRSG